MISKLPRPKLDAKADNPSDREMQSYLTRLVSELEFELNKAYTEIENLRKELERRH